MKSLRARLLVFMLAATIPMVAIVGFSLFSFVRSSLLARFDDTMTSRAQALMAAAKIEAQNIEFDFAGEAMPQYQRPGGHEYFQLWRLRDGAPAEVIEKSPSLGDLSLIPAVPASAEALSDAALPDGVAGRLLARRFTPRADAEPDAPPAEAMSSPPELLLVVARSRADLDRTLGFLGTALAASGLALAGGIAVAIFLALSRALRPVADLTRQVADISPADLHRRIAGGHIPSELRPVVDRLNDLLARMHAAFLREKRMTASAAHELRTPVAEIRAVTELALSRARAAPDYERALRDVLHVAARMEASVAALLRLARLESGAEPVRLEPVDLPSILAPIWQRLIAPTSQRAIRAHVHAPDPLPVLADPAMLAVILENLLANAARYTPDRGEIAASVSHSDHAAELRIQNSTDPLAKPDRAEHLGLGLPLARAMAAACGGRCEAASNEPGTFIARLSLKTPTQH